MSLTNAELARIKAELGFNLLTSSAAPWINTTVLFEQIVRPYLDAGTATTSATAVVAASTPTPVAITLASATGFAAGNRIWIDVDDRQESATIQSLSGSAATVALTKDHTGTYPVSLDSGESMVRELLARIKATKESMAGIFGTGSLKKVDEIEWYQPGAGKTQFGLLGDQLTFWRDELAALLGAPNLWRERRGAGSNVAMY